MLITLKIFEDIMSRSIAKITTLLILSSTAVFASDPREQDLRDIRTLVNLTPSAFRNPLETQIYHLGKEEPFSCTGFSGLEGNLRWTNDLKATMTVPLQLGNHDVKRVEFTNTVALVTDAHPQRLSVRLNGVNEVKYEYNTMINSQTINIPCASYGFSGDAIISFDMPDAISPTDLGVGEDSRRLGIAFREMVVSSRKALTDEQKNKNSWVTLYCTNEEEFWEKIFSLQSKLEEKVSDPLNRGRQRILERNMLKNNYESTVNNYTNSINDMTQWVRTLEIPPDQMERASILREENKKRFLGYIEEAQKNLTSINAEIEEEKPQYKEYKELSDTFNNFMDELGTD